MARGTRIDQFKVGQRIKFVTDIGEKHFSDKHDPSNRMRTIQVFSHKVNIIDEAFGRILKLHRSGKQGSADIKPERPIGKTGMRKINRRLQHVTAM